MASQKVSWADREDSGEGLPVPVWGKSAEAQPRAQPRAQPLAQPRAKPADGGPVFKWGASGSGEQQKTAAGSGGPKLSGGWGSLPADRGATSGGGGVPKPAAAPGGGGVPKPAAAAPGGWGAPTVSDAASSQPAFGVEKPDSVEKSAVPSDSAVVGSVLPVEAISREELEEELSGLISVKEGDLVVQQDDPTSPLHSVKSFEDLGLPEPLKKGIYAMKFRKPSKIQETALPLILANPPRNLVAQAQSGTGKTAAFVLGMLARCQLEVMAPQAIAVCHTRELAQQVLGVVKEMGQFTGLRCINLIKDETPPYPPAESHLVVGTPGKLHDFLRVRREGGRPVRRLPTEHVKVFVIDEADELMGKQGFKTQTMSIRSQLPKRLQVLMFSATFRDDVKRFVQNFVPNPNLITLKPQEVAVDKIMQFYFMVEDAAVKFSVLASIYAFLTMGQSIIFVHTRRTAQELHRNMTQEGHAVSLLHGADMTPVERERVMNEFRQGKSKVLITTNVLARGIDVLQTSVVINYDIPMDEHGRPDPETYIHRIGRSGRFGRKGVAITFVHDRASFDMLGFIENAIQRPIRRLDIADIENLDSIVGHVA